MYACRHKVANTAAHWNHMVHRLAVVPGDHNLCLNLGCVAATTSQFVTIGYLWHFLRYTLHQPVQCSEQLLADLHAMMARARVKQLVLLMQIE